MKCKFCRSSLSSYLDGECSQAQAKRIKTHLEKCQECRQELADLKKVSTILKQLNKVQASESYDFDFQRRLKGEIDKEKRITYGTEKVILLNLKTVFKGIRDVLQPVPVFAKVSVALLILVGIALSMVNIQKGSLPMVIATKGTAEIRQTKDDEWLMVKSNMRLREGNAIRTSENSYIDIQQGRLYKLRLKENSEASIAKLVSRYRKNITNLEINRGIILVNIEKRLEGLEFRINTPTATALAHGTGFLVDVSRDTGEVWLGVLEGEVMVTSHYGLNLEGKEPTVAVKAGQKTIVSSNRLPSVPMPLTDVEWNRLQEIEDIGRLLVSLVISDSPTRARELLGVSRLYVYGREPIEVQQLVTRAVSLLEQANRQDDRKKHLESINKLEEVITRYPDPRYNPQFLLFIGAYYERLSLHEKAIDSFREVVTEYANSKWASLAQCVIGIIQEESLNDYAKAMESYQKVLSNYPASLEVSEAKDGLQRLAAN